MKKRIWQLLFPSCLTFGQQNKISNRDHDVLLYTLSFIPAHIGTPENVLDLCYREILLLLLLQGNEKHYLPIKSSSTPKIFSELSITNFSEFIQYFPSIAD